MLRNKDPLCSVVIANYNGKAVLKDCLKSIEETDYPSDRIEIIVVDNNSTDGSVEFIKKNFRKVKIVEVKENLGNSEGVNRGVEIARGDYIINLDNDTVVGKKWLRKLVDVAKSDEKIGICGSNVDNINYGFSVGEGRLGPLGIPDVRVRVGKFNQYFFVSGCSMLVKREVVDKLEFFFDPSFFAYFEDVDLCWRAMLAGYKVVYVPESNVKHLKGFTASKMGNRMKLYHYKNKITSYRKNTRFPLTQILMAPVFISTFAIMVYLGITSSWEYGITVLKHSFEKLDKNPILDNVSLKNQLKIFFI